MSEITAIERIERLQALYLRLVNNVHQLRSDEELDAVTGIIFDQLEDLGNRILALEHNLDIVEMTISTANG